jgi:CheY-like chemotaxis protein
VRLETESRMGKSDEEGQTDRLAATRAGRTPVILAYETDLWFVSRIRAAASHLSVPVEIVRRVEHLPNRADIVQPALVLLNMAGADHGWVAAIAALKSSPATAAIPVVAYGPHVDATAQTAARTAGADRVLSNQRFTETLPDLLARYLSSAGG